MKENNIQEKAGVTILSYFFGVCEKTIYNVINGETWKLSSAR